MIYIINIYITILHTHIFIYIYILLYYYILHIIHTYKLYYICNIYENIISYMHYIIPVPLAECNQLNNTSSSASPGWCSTPRSWSSATTMSGICLADSADLYWYTSINDDVCWVLLKSSEMTCLDSRSYSVYRCTGHCQCNKGKRNEGNTLNRTGCRALACTWRPRRPSCRSGGIRDPKARRQAGPHELIRKETKQPQASCRVAEGASQSARSSCWQLKQRWKWNQGVRMAWLRRGQKSKKSG